LDPAFAEMAEIEVALNAPTGCFSDAEFTRVFVSAGKPEDCENLD
jgi:hypothetical protein